jgi:galactonate dehydratase
MKITKLETIRLGTFPNLIYVRVHTDEAIVGLGETFFGPGAVESYVHESAAPRLLGLDPLQIDRIAQVLRPYVGATNSGAETRGNSAVDVALWDIFGKVTGLPVFQLLGGASRDDIPVYNTCAGPGYVRRPLGQAVANWGLPEPGRPGAFEDLDAFLHHADELALDLLASGVKGMKIWPFDPFAEQTGGQYIEPAQLEAALEPFRKIRAAVGRQLDVMVEMHGLWALPAAQRIARSLAEFEPFWLEDPLKPSLLPVTLKQLVSQTAAPLALSETLAGRTSFIPFLEQGLIGVVLLDISWCGGLTEAKKIASLAEAYQIPVAPHDCTGPVVLTASAHLSVNVPNAFIQEMVRAYYYGWYGELVTELPPVTAGRVKPPSGPGLGTELRPDIWHRPDVTVRVSAL